MTIAAVTAADYATTVNTIRGHLAAGTRMNDYEMRLALAVVKQGGGVPVALTALTDAVTAQLVILQAKGTADASAEIDTADTTLAALITTALAASTEAVSITDNDNADG